MTDAPLIDPRTLLLVATVMILLNGAVLGLMHGSLAPDTQPAARSWRIATLLIAAACVLLAVQWLLPPLLALPLANGCLLVGLTGYWRALRQFHGLPDRWILLLPAALGTAGIAWLAEDAQRLGLRIVIASLAMAAVLVGAAWTLATRGRDEPMASRRVLRVLILAMAMALVARAFAAAAWPPEATTVLGLRSGINAIALVSIAVLPVIGTTAFVLMCLEHIRGQWQRAASTDYLTGLPNRRTVAMAGERGFQEARRHADGFAIGLIDVDHFKRINDRHGHDTGDLALRHLAERLRASARQGDLAGRLGGEEFVLLWPRADAASAEAAARRFQQDLAAHPVPAPSGPLPMTVSIGIAVMSPGDTGFDSLLRRADKAMYAAKAAGRDRIELAPRTTD